jgi:hypothetical protein
MEDGWQGHLREAEAVFFDVQLGPDMVEDARRYVPIDTSRLHDSLDHEVNYREGGPPELQVGSFPDEDGDVEYAAAVELGFHGFEVVREHERRTRHGTTTVREHIRHANQPEEPYLRPSLYQERYG